jgi:hypothetical protein
MEETLLDLVPASWKGIVATVLLLTGAVGGVVQAVAAIRNRKSADDSSVAPSPASTIESMPDSLSVALKCDKLLSALVVHDPSILRASIVQIDVNLDNSRPVRKSVLMTKGIPFSDELDKDVTRGYYDNVIVPLLNSRNWVWRTVADVGDSAIAAMYRATEGMVGATMYYIAHSENDEGQVESIMVLSLHCMTKKSLAPVARQLIVDKLREIANN